MNERFNTVDFRFGVRVIRNDSKVCLRMELAQDPICSGLVAILSPEEARTIAEMLNEGAFKASVQDDNIPAIAYDLPHVIAITPALEQLKRDLEFEKAIQNVNRSTCKSINQGLPGCNSHPCQC